MATVRSPNPHRGRVKVVKDLLDAFFLERVVYLALSAIAAVLLLISSSLLILNRDATTAQIAFLFGGGGAVAFTVSRVLRMWSDALEYIGKADKEADG
jgi:hypothetical protein